MSEPSIPQFIEEVRYIPSNGSSTSTEAPPNNNYWFIITGAPSTGKTTLLDVLKQRGYRVIYELARQYIDDQIQNHGKTLEDIRGDHLKEQRFQDEVLQLKITTEKKLPREEIVFFERGIPGNDSGYYWNYWV